MNIDSCFLCLSFRITFSDKNILWAMLSKFLCLKHQFLNLLVAVTRKPGFREKSSHVSLTRNLNIFIIKTLVSHHSYRRNVDEGRIGILFGVDGINSNPMTKLTLQKIFDGFTQWSYPERESGDRRE